MTYTKSANEIFQTKIDCNIIDIINYNYFLICKGNNREYYNFQNSLSFINDEILIINFDKNADSIIYIEESEKEYNIKNKLKKKGSLGAGAIVAIILVVTVVILGTLIPFIYLRKSKNKENNVDSTIISLNV